MAHYIMIKIYFIFLVAHPLLCVKVLREVLTGAPLAAASLDPEHEMAHQVPKEFNLISQQTEQAIKSIDMSGVPTLDELPQETLNQVQPVNLISQQTEQANKSIDMSGVPTLDKLPQETRIQVQPVTPRLSSQTLHRQRPATGSVHSRRSGLLPSREYQSADYWIEAAKPRFDYETSIEFQYNSHEDECVNVAAEMKESSSTVGAGEVLAYISTQLAKAKENYVDLLNLDKHIYNALDQLYINLPHDVDVAGIGTSDGGKDLAHYMRQLIQCKVDVENDWTLVQAVIAYGLSQTVKHDFIFQLLIGEYNFDPAMMLDKNGNTLLHLAVMSGQETVFNTVISLEQTKNHRAERVHNYHLWCIACLTHVNNAQKIPLDLTNVLSFQNRVKGLFRFLTSLVNEKVQKLQTSASSTDSKKTMPTIWPMGHQMVAAGA